MFGRVCFHIICDGFFTHGTDGTHLFYNIENTRGYLRYYWGQASSICVYTTGGGGDLRYYWGGASSTCVDTTGGGGAGEPGKHV